ncbi:MAG: hypothetical protein K0B11_15390 [Mariniphaga sp.]|nr:hypothetical protein [Mariniphaga sp.]
MREYPSKAGQGSVAVRQLPDPKLRVSGSAEGITSWDPRFPLTENERVGLISDSLLFMRLKHR